jgi:hypothetical protein
MRGEQMTRLFEMNAYGDIWQEPELALAGAEVEEGATQLAEVDEGVEYYLSEQYLFDTI